MRSNPIGMLLRVLSGQSSSRTFPEARSGDEKAKTKGEGGSIWKPTRSSSRKEMENCFKTNQCRSMTSISLFSSHLFSSLSLTSRIFLLFVMHLSLSLPLYDMFPSSNFPKHSLF